MTVPVGRPILYVFYRLKRVLDDLLREAADAVDDAILGDTGRVACTPCGP